MTTSLTAPAAAAGTATTGLRRTGIAFIVAGIVWILGDIGEIVLFSAGAGGPGPALLIGQTIFDIAIIAYVLALVGGARRGLAGRSTIGRIGLIVTAVCMLVILVATTLAMASVPQLTVVLPYVGPLRNVAEILAGVGILLGGAQPVPARAIYLVYSVALFLPMAADYLLPNSGEGPGFIDEIGQALLWIIIGVSIRRATPERPGRLWFVLAIVVGVIVLAGIAVPH